MCVCVCRYIYSIQLYMNCSNSKLELIKPHSRLHFVFPFLTTGDDVSDSNSRHSEVSVITNQTTLVTTILNYPFAT